ncbi:MAG: DUF2344 domain-containing protein, partial [Clostridia bacterium]|nr:DUF2344 domain-containing protein [Clostridia bacterium]
MTDFRIIFSKKGSLAFISHLDLTHTFIRALKRAGIPLKYSEGFNPRPKMAFGLPLSVGTEGENEILDLSLSRDLSCEELKEKLQGSLSDEIQIKSVSEPGKKIKNIKYAVYRVTVSEDNGPEITSRKSALPERFEFESGTLCGTAYTYDSAYATTGETVGMCGGFEHDGDGISLDFTVPESGDYELAIVYGKANDGPSP